MLSSISASFIFLSSCLSFTSAIPIESSSFGKAGRNASYDYVVIGGGTAGLVVAARLAQASHSVAVIEAGGFYQDAGNYSTVPAYSVFSAGASPKDMDPLIDWGFVTTSQAGVNNRTLHYARGKTLGGSSARNYFTYQRPTKESLDKWATEVGDSAYSYQSFLPYLKKSVDFTPPNNHLRPSNASVPFNPKAFTSGAGPLRVSIAIWANSFSSYAKLAFEKLGFPVTVDFVSGTLSGVQYCMNSIDPNGQVRSTSFSSFLETAMKTTNIQVYNNTMAKRILFDDKTAYGAVVNSGSDDYTLHATKEVILSAGAFQSPQMLMISGVGPADTLKKFNIPIISDLQGVGQNLQDHLLFGASYQVKTLTHSAISHADYSAMAAAEYDATGAGMFGNPGGELLAWEKLPALLRGNLSVSTLASLAKYPSDWPEIEYLILDAYSGDNQDYFTGAPRTPYMYASPAAGVVTAQSRGSVTIASNDVTVPPVIDPNWLTHPADQELAVIAFKRIRDMMDMDVIKGIWVEEVVPGRNISSDADILNAIRQNGIQMFHASVTCKMGRSNDSMAVVDAKGRVFGTKGLRVVDSSALPFLPPGHPQAVIYALAEKISDDILMT